MGQRLALAPAACKPSTMTQRPTQRRMYDVEDLVKLLVGDIEIDLQPYTVSPELREKLFYWIGRGWDAGRAAVERNG